VSPKELRELRSFTQHLVCDVEAGIASRPAKILRKFSDLPRASDTSSRSRRCWPTSGNLKQTIGLGPRRGAAGAWPSSASTSTSPDPTRSRRRCSVARFDQLQHLRPEGPQAAFTIKNGKNGLASLIEVAGGGGTLSLLLEECQLSLQPGTGVNRSHHCGGSGLGGQRNSHGSGKGSRFTGSIRISIGPMGRPGSQHNRI